MGAGGGAVDDAAVESAIVAALSGADPDPQRAAALLVAHGFPVERARRAVFDAVAALNRRLFPPLSKLELLLAEGCNMACAYCFEHAILTDGARRRRVMSHATIARAVDLVVAYAQPGAEIDVTLFGGEPTLAMDGVRFAVETVTTRCAENDLACRFAMTTNGLLLDAATIETCVSRNVKILLSVDGLAPSHDAYRRDKQGHGTFDAVLGALKRLKALQPWIGVKMTIMPSEAGRLFDNVRGLHDLGVNQFLIGRATGVAWPSTARDALASEMTRLGRWIAERPRHDLVVDGFSNPSAPGVFGCGAARQGIAVNVAGEVSGCARILSLDSGRVVGKLGDVAFGLYRWEARAEMISCAQLRAHCVADGLDAAYLGGCFAVNYEDTGDLYRPSRVEQEMLGLLEAARAPFVGAA